MSADLERFMSHTRHDADGCIVWTGSRKETGYGFFSIRSKVVIAHRWIYEQTHGPQPGLVIMHRCDNPSCVNVEHLRAGTQADNIHDAVAKQRQCRGERVTGSKLTPDDVRAIRAAAASGTPKRALARQYGIDVKNIRALIDGRSWRHING